MTRKRIEREKTTAAAMIAIYCRAHHAPEKDLCSSCSELRDYAFLRLRCCVFGEEKPTCADCPVHCYGAAMRERICEVMRYAGPRMLLFHPWLALRHLLDGFRPAPPRRKPQAGSTNQH